MSEPKEIKLKRITIKTETGSKWFDEPEKLLAWVQQQRQLYMFHGQLSQRYQMHQLFSVFDNSWNNLGNALPAFHKINNYSNAKQISLKLN